MVDSHRHHNAAELARQIGTHAWECPKCNSPVWYRAVLSSHMHVCENKDCGWLTFDPARDAKPVEIPSHADCDGRGCDACLGSGLPPAFLKGDDE